MTIYRIVDNRRNNSIRLFPNEIEEITRFSDEDGQCCLYIKAFSILESPSNNLLYFVIPVSIECLQNNIYKEAEVLPGMSIYFTLNEQLAVVEFERLLKEYA